MSFSGSLMSHAGPTPPEELPPLEEELLLDVPESPLEPELELDDEVPVSGFAESGTPLSMGSLSVFGGSFVLLSGVEGSVFASWTSAPRPSSGDVAQRGDEGNERQDGDRDEGKATHGRTLAAELLRCARRCCHGDAQVTPTCRHLS